jgi:hypothetical protein
MLFALFSRLTYWTVPSFFHCNRKKVCCKLDLSFLEVGIMCLVLTLRETMCFVFVVIALPMQTELALECSFFQKDNQRLF